jgi:putative membrane protein
MTMMDMMNGMGWWMVLWGLIGLAVLVLVVLGIVWLVRSLSGPGRGAAMAADPAEQELRRRYAAGEITGEQYRERLTDLRQHRPPG